MTTKEYLISRFGLLLTLEDLSAVLKRSPDGLRISLRGKSSFAKDWRGARTKIGRRVYFHAHVVADLIETGIDKES